MSWPRPLQKPLAIIGVLVIGVAVAILARQSTSQEARGVTRVTDGTVVLGIVANLSGRPNRPDELLVRGLKLWQARIAEQGGVRYQANGRKAALEVRVSDAHGSAATASEAAAELLRRGANVLVGPFSGVGTAAVAAQARAHSALFISGTRQPLNVPSDSLSRFLSPPQLGDFRGVLDAFYASRTPRSNRGATRVAVVASLGSWSVRARRTLELVRARGYTARLFRFPAARFKLRSGSQLPDLQRGVSRFRPNVVLLSTGYRIARAMAAGPRFDDADLLAAAAGSVEEIRADPPVRDLVLALPWSPSEGLGGPIFPAGELVNDYEDRYGKLPTYPVAAGASLGELLSAGVLLAQSTEMSRVARAIDQLRIGSPAGLLQFKAGVQVAPSSVAVVVGPDGAPRQLWPLPAAPGYKHGRLPVRAKRPAAP